jgi:hypothetical protein
VSVEYDYDDPKKLWPCLGPMTLAELNAEWLRCWKLLRLGDEIVRYDHRLSERVRGIAEEELSREFLRINHGRFVRGEARPDGEEFERWTFAKFMAAPR